MSSKKPPLKVPLHVEEDEKKLLIDHDYDGIQELNHPLPKWWRFFFYTGIIFGAGYWVYYSFLGGPTLRDEHNKEMVTITAKQNEYKKQTSQFKQQEFSELDENEHRREHIAEGLKVYTDNCVQCHLDGGQGDIGPNLTDDSWLVSKGTPETNYNIVYSGSEANGMPAWGEVLSADDIYKVLVYLKSISNTFHPQGKAAQGEKIVNP